MPENFEAAVRVRPVKPVKPRPVNQTGGNEKVALTEPHIVRYKGPGGINEDLIILPGGHTPLPKHLRPDQHGLPLPRKNQIYRRGILVWADTNKPVHPRPVRKAEPVTEKMVQPLPKESPKGMTRREFTNKAAHIVVGAATVASGARFLGITDKALTDLKKNLEEVISMPSANSQGQSGSGEASANNSPKKEVETIQQNNSFKPSKPQYEESYKQQVQHWVKNRQELGKFGWEMNNKAIEKINNGDPAGLFFDLYSPLIEAAEAKYHVPANLIRSLLLFESGFHPSIISGVEAIGLGQIMPQFWGNEWDLTDAATNIDLSAKILDQYRGQRNPRPERHNNETDTSWKRRINNWHYAEIKAWKAALKSYNAGPSRNYTSIATVKYADNIIELYQAIENGTGARALIDFCRQGQGIMGMLYWHLLPRSPVDKFIAVNKSSDHGLDFTVTEGTAIYPSTAGKIVYTAGDTVIVEIDTSLTDPLYKIGPLRVIYSNLGQMAKNLQVGQTVDQNNVLGFAGSDGQFHFAYAWRGRVDPNTGTVNGAIMRYARELLPPEQGFPGKEKISA